MLASLEEPFTHWRINGVSKHTIYHFFLAWESFHLILSNIQSPSHLVPQSTGSPIQLVPSVTWTQSTGPPSQLVRQSRGPPSPLVRQSNGPPSQKALQSISPQFNWSLNSKVPPSQIIPQVKSPSSQLVTQLSINWSLSQLIPQVDWFTQTTQNDQTFIKIFLKHIFVLIFSFRDQFLAALAAVTHSLSL